MQIQLHSNAYGILASIPDTEHFRDKETYKVLYKLSRLLYFTTYEVLSEPAETCRRYDENIWAYFFKGHGIHNAHSSRRLIKKAVHSRPTDSTDATGIPLLC